MRPFPHTFASHLPLEDGHIATNGDPITVPEDPVAYLGGPGFYELLEHVAGFTRHWHLHAGTRVAEEPREVPLVALGLTRILTEPGFVRMLLTLGESVRRELGPIYEGGEPDESTPEGWRYRWLKEAGYLEKSVAVGLEYPRVDPESIREDLKRIAEAGGFADTD